MIREEVKKVSSGYLMIVVLGTAQIMFGYMVVASARAQIVRGAVSMVEMALEKLRENNLVDLDEERKAAMVSNLLVVLCGEEGVRPVVNTGSLYT